MIVLVTIHGIGFQLRPSAPNTQDGYADALHAALGRQLPAGMLGDDPNRPSGPVYVESSWPPGSDKTEPGLARLGTWKENTVDIAGASLVRGDASVAHVALVYSRLEEQSEDTVALLGLGLLGGSGISHYATVGSIIRMAFRDVRAMHVQPGASTPSLAPRETASDHRGFLSRLFHHPAPGSSGPDANAEPTSTFRQVQDDIAAYVVRNEHRERVRAFVRDAVSRIMARPDVTGVIVNGHSNGCVMAFDFLAAMSPPQAPRVRALVTSGCPLRKYVDFMDWGTDSRSLGLVQANRWTNFFDEADPVADPMQPPATWKRDDTDSGPGLFVRYDPVSGQQSNVAVKDIKVDNVGAHVGGGLPAHNYWDNVDGFVTPLAGIVRDAVASGETDLIATAAAKPIPAARNS